MGKRISAFFLAVCLTLGMLSGTARAESGGALPFRDVAEDAAYYYAVRYVYENHLMNGTTDALFEPDGTMDRAQLATVLYRLEGSPAVSGASFRDVEPGQWYTDAIAWASAENLVSGYSGYSGGRFGPADPVTREDMATILHRYAKYKGYPSRGETLANFEDVSEVASYAVEPMKWAVNYGVISGGELAPKSHATRAQIAVALHALSVTGQYAELANQRRESIRAARTDCTADVTGTIYYISNDGDDSNDGLSPETAWATPYTAMKKGLKAGDAVLFARGDTWYVDVETNIGNTEYNLSFADGVNIGAYGDGAKPVLRGDIAEANDPAFWEIFSEKNGAKIWKAARDLRDCTVIVFNEGEAWAEEVFPWWDGGTQYIDPDGTPFVVEEALDRDLTFCNLLDLDCDRTHFTDRIDPFYTGELYLRCDAGNPAEVYDVVSVPQEIVGIEILPHSSVRDLDIRYCTMMGTQCTDHGTPMEDYRFANLEIGWCGGWLQNYSPADDKNDRYQPHIAGGAIGAYSTELSVTDCYIHHSGPMTMIISMHDLSPDTAETIAFKNQRFAGNLFEYCAAPIHWADLTPMDNSGSKGFLSNLVYEDNLFMYTGDGWLYNYILQSETGGPTSFWLSAVENGYGAADNDGIHIRNNVFFLSQWATVNLREYLWGDEKIRVNKQPVFSGNTYVQLADRLLFLWFWEGDGYPPSEEVMTEQIGDTEGTLIVLGQR